MPRQKVTRESLLAGVEKAKQSLEEAKSRLRDYDDKQSRERKDKLVEMINESGKSIEELEEIFRP